MMIVHRDSKDRHRKKIRENDHYNDLEGRKVSDKARERFERKPYSIKKEVTIMTVRDLIGRLLAGMQSGEVSGDDKVTIDLFQESMDVAEYFADKYGIGGDSDGQCQN